MCFWVLIFLYYYIAKQAHCNTYFIKSTVRAEEPEADLANLPQNVIPVSKCSETISISSYIE